MMTNAESARRISRINKTTGDALRYLAEGMWNPDFCSDDASAHVLSVCSDIREQIENIERRVAMKKPAP